LISNGHFSASVEDAALHNTEYAAKKIDKSCTTVQHKMERRFQNSKYRAFAQPCRRTISLIQIGANGEVQPLETG
jgi:hypothetical protein